MRLTDFCVGGKSIAEMTASHVMETDVICSDIKENCHDLSETFYKEGIGSIPIVDKEKTLIGLVSEYDVLNVLRKGMDLRNTLAFEVMTREVVSIKKETTVEDVILILQSHHLIRVPVVDAQGKLIGILARRDILGAYYESTFGPLPSF